MGKGFLLLTSMSMSLFTRFISSEICFTVRKISYGEGVERIFPYASPNIDNIEVLKRGKVRRARLYYLRDLVGKKARIKERQMLKK